MEDNIFTHKTNAHILPRVSARANPLVSLCIPHGQRPLRPTSQFRTMRSTGVSIPTGAAMVEAAVQLATATTGAAAKSGKITATEGAGNLADGEAAHQHQHQVQPSPLPSQEQLPSNPIITITNHCKSIKAPMGLVAYEYTPLKFKPQPSIIPQPENHLNLII